MRCSSCGGNMTFNKEEYGFSCPFCGAFEKLNQELSEEEIQKLIDNSISKHRKLDHSTDAVQKNKTLNILSSVVGNIFLFFCTLVVLVVAIAMTTKKQYMPLAIIAFCQTALFIAAIFIRSINRALERDKLAIVANILIIIASVLVVVFVGVGLFIG